MENLTFYVQGSDQDKEPYKLTSAGSGIYFKLNCSCPAGRSGVLCKHVAFLMHGDVTKMVRCLPTDAMDQLLVLSAISMQLRATGAVVDSNLDKERKAKRESVHEGLDTIEAVYAVYGAELRGMGWDVRVKVLAFPSKGTAIDLHGYYKRGAKICTYVDPSISISMTTEKFEFDEEEWDWDSGDLPDVEASAEDDANGEWKPRTNPWTVTGKAVNNTRSFRYGPKAIEMFLECARNIGPMKG